MNLCDAFKRRCRQSAATSACKWLAKNEDGISRGQHDHDALTYDAVPRILDDHISWLADNVSRENATVVAYLSSNCIDFFLSVLACSSPSVSATPALLNTRWSIQEIVDALDSPDESDVTIVLYSPDMKSTSLGVQPQMNHKTVCIPIPELWKARREALRSSEPALLSPTTALPLLIAADLCPEDALIVFTSGTSGKSKGVRLSHRAILIQAQAKCQDPCNYDSSTRLLATTVPFYHVGGLSSILATWLAGGTLIFPTLQHTAAFDPWLVLRALSAPSHIAPNTLAVVPAMLFGMENKMEELQSVGTALSFPSVQLVLVGGQSASQRNLNFTGRIFPNARIVQTYACTEAASSLTFLDVNELPSTRLPSDVSGECIGHPPLHVQICLFTDKKQLTPPYKVGNIAFRGPCRMNGYWSRGDNRLGNKQSSDKCFVTNDLGFWDDRGRLYFAGRSTDSIRTGGETVFAAPVERIILRHPLVTECAVFGLKDDRFGETVGCAVVCKAKCPSLAELRAFCEQQGLAGYKRPTCLHMLTELPRNSAGKVLKFRLVEQFGKQPATLSKL